MGNKLTRNEQAILKVLKKGESHAYKIASDSKGLVSLGSVYGCLQGLHDKGLVFDRLEYPRRYFRLTVEGEEAIESSIRLLSEL